MTMCLPNQMQFSARKRSSMGLYSQKTTNFESRCISVRNRHRNMRKNGNRMLLEGICTRIRNCDWGSRLYLFSYKNKRSWFVLKKGIDFSKIANVYVDDKILIINHDHLIPNIFSHKDTKPLSSTLSGICSKSTFSNWNWLLAIVFKAYLHLSLSIKPSLFKSKSTKILEIYSLLNIPVLNPCFCFSFRRSIKNSLMFTGCS